MMSEFYLTNLRRAFLKTIREHDMSKMQVLVVAVVQPNGAIEVIVNHAPFIQEKAEYYSKAYDDGFRLKSNQDIRIVRWMIV
jgi:hypothetical protein